MFMSKLAVAEKAMFGETELERVNPRMWIGKSFDKSTGNVTEISLILLNDGRIKLIEQILDKNNKSLFYFKSNFNQNAKQIETEERRGSSDTTDEVRGENMVGFLKNKEVQAELTKINKTTLTKSLNHL
ncbi:MAG: hypothetical protein Sv326_0486 [Candidatus Fermentimicrarchaeum limneticum]|uniref:Uncharacterized protein n=1 Tax=Fermentimicrarchaeum limneticum TaxID=2795018 RepID=A0A7D6BSV4_FERL1|nr:MAG: hypothetical protein Sv326_0486 [Candidatus Fermentimicrarchaeum limneticum]